MEEQAIGPMQTPTVLTGGRHPTQAIPHALLGLRAHKWELRVFHTSLSSSAFSLPTLATGGGMLGGGGCGAQAGGD